jgi:hypothetical protein
MPKLRKVAPDDKKLVKKQPQEWKRFGSFSRPRLFPKASSVSSFEPMGFTRRCSKSGGIRLSSVFAAQRRRRSSSCSGRAERCVSSAASAKTKPSQKPRRSSFSKKSPGDLGDEDDDTDPKNDE